MLQADTAQMATLKTVSAFVALAKDLLTILALIGGWLIAYYKFFRGRTFHPRLELDVSADVMDVERQTMIRVTVKLKNVGLSRVVLNHEASALWIFVRDREDFPPDFSMAPDWTKVGAFSVLDEHGWIESGETIEGQYVYSLPAERATMAKATVQLAAKKQNWKAECIVTRTEEIS